MEPDTPPSIARGTQALMSLIRQASPNKATQTPLEGNAKNWEYTALLMLREHHVEAVDRDILKQANVPDPIWENPFKIAVGWICNTFRKLRKRC